MSVPVSTLNSSPARCPALPVLPEANDELAGIRLGVCDEFLHRIAPAASVDDQHVGRVATSVIGAKSFTASYGIFAYRLGLIACVDSAPITIV